MYERGKLLRLRHRLLWILIRTVALILVALGMITASKAYGGAAWHWVGGGLLLMLLGLLLERNHAHLLKNRWPAQCPKCGCVMDTAHKLWEAPDDSPQWYVEYTCRSCQMRYTNDVFGKTVYGWPPKVLYIPREREPLTLADGIKAVVALLVGIAIIAFLYWTGLVGNLKCDPNCF